ncbi:hypothetical protein KIKIMORA_01390 [Brevundimonas phage vB_BpoS-Kikimora]|uniref:Uncharacterized protein n=1 Tax=Brevundimonas phage vB_BpoS-Kikimora TaxID=2948601 RepID=A0A9E7MRN5_9CAUD|nr:hypothetical protein KIKIMORA_01390 [Brevundimonas phage vB_BpoS-Kikimora]
MIEHRWALVEREFGDVILVELTELSEKGGVGLIGLQPAHIPLHTILTRSNSQARMAFLKDKFDQVWKDTESILDDGVRNVESLRERFPASDLVDREIEAAKLRFHVHRDARWRQAIGMLRAHPIDPRSPPLAPSIQ